MFQQGLILFLMRGMVTIFFLGLGGKENCGGDIFFPVGGVQIFYSIKGRLQSKFVLDQSSSFIQGRLLAKVANFYRTVGVHTKKWGRISPAD